MGDSPRRKTLQAKMLTWISIFAFLAVANGQTIYDFHVNDIDGNGVGLDKYRGDVVVIVNVATN